jgi:hypothetical protein
VQEHRYSFEIDAPPEEIWSVMHRRPDEVPGGTGEVGEYGPIRRKIVHGPVTIEILHEGDENTSGLVRHCFFRVPKYLLSGGVAQSWEHVTDVVPNESAKYYAIGKPLWSRAEGEHRFEPLPDGRTRVHFVERYHVYNPLMRLLLEKRVHRFISKDNDKLVRAGIEQALAAKRKSARSSEGLRSGSPAEREAGILPAPPA